LAVWSDSNGWLHGSLQQSYVPTGAAASVKSGARGLSPAAPILGSAASFAVFGGGAGITNQGTNTVITGDMGNYRRFRR